MSESLVLAYERRFVPALAWSVRGAMLQLGGRMAVVEDDGRVAFEARAGTGLVFTAIVLGVTAVFVLIAPMFLVGKPWFPQYGHGMSSAIGALSLVGAIVCYAVAMNSLRIVLYEGDRDVVLDEDAKTPVDETTELATRPAARAMVGQLVRGRSFAGRHVWYVQDAMGDGIGAIRPGRATDLEIAAGSGRTLMVVLPSVIPGLGQAAWRPVEGTGSKGRLRIGMGAGARLEIDDEGITIDHRLLAALLLVVAVEGK